jgi:hypothetical protein
MKIECAETWNSHNCTTFWFSLDETQVLALASGSVPKVIQAQAMAVLSFRDQDEAAAEFNRAKAERDEKPKRRKGKAA